MTLEEFKKHCEEQEDWAPGWDAIDEVFEKLYPNQEPNHYGTIITSRPIFGGDEWIDGYSYYNSPKGYTHVVTYGLSELYTDEESLGGEYSKWGYEMTMKLKGDHESNQWAMRLLGHLARYTNVNKSYFEEFQYISIDVRELAGAENSKMVAMIIVPDTEAKTISTLYGEVQFLQLVAITQKEFDSIKHSIDNIKVIYEKLKQVNPDLVIDFDRTEEMV